MPRNKVVERMAKKLCGLEYWEQLSENTKDMWREETLEQLGIVEEHYNRIMGCDAELLQAFQLTRKAKNGRKRKR